MIGKGDVPSIHLKISSKGLKFMKKVDGLRLLFINIYDQAFTSRLNSTDTSLQISENITPFADRLYDLVVRVPGYRSRGPGFDSRLYQIF
jgi:hypothetical protein